MASYGTILYIENFITSSVKHKNEQDLLACTHALNSMCNRCGHIKQTLDISVKWLSETLSE